MLKMASMLTKFLEHASLFEIYQVIAVLKDELNDLGKIAAVREKIKVGDAIEYLNVETKLFGKAYVLKKHLRYLDVKLEDNQKQKIPYYLLVPDSLEPDFNDLSLLDDEVKEKMLCRKLTPATSAVSDKEKWRVYYHSFPFMKDEIDKIKKK